VILGLNAWSVLLLVPFLVAAPTALDGLLWLLLPLVALAVGTKLQGRVDRGGADVWLLAVFPATIALVMIRLPGLPGQSPHGPLSLILGAVSLIAFAAATAAASSRSRSRRPCRQVPLGHAQAFSEPVRTSWIRRSMLLLAISGAFGLSFVAPLLAGRDGYEAAWGEAANAAFVLTAVVGASLGCAILAVFVGPALRASRKRPRSTLMANRRFLLFMSVAFLGSLTYALLQVLRQG